MEIEISNFWYFGLSAWYSKFINLMEYRSRIRTYSYSNPLISEAIIKALECSSCFKLPSVLQASDYLICLSDFGESSNNWEFCINPSYAIGLFL